MVFGQTCLVRSREGAWIYSARSTRTLFSNMVPQAAKNAKKLRRLSRRCPWKLGVGCNHPASWKMPAGLNKSQNRWWTSWFTTLVVIVIIVTVSGSQNLDVTSFNFKSFRSTSPEQLVNASTFTFFQLYGFTQPSEKQDVRLHTSASVLGFQGILRQTLEQAAWELICQWQPENCLWSTWNAKPKMRIWFSVTL